MHRYRRPPWRRWLIALSMGVALGFVHPTFAAAQEPRLSRYGTPCFEWPYEMRLHGPLTEDVLVRHHWVLGSWIYQISVRDGFPIQFLSDGEVVTKNLALVTKWRLNAAGELELFYDHSVLAYTFAYDESCGALVSAPRDDPSMKSLNIPHVDIILAR